MLANSLSDINQTEAVVLRSHASGDSNLVLKILSPQFGKLSVFVKNARSSRKRFAGNIEILDRGIFSFKESLTNSRAGGLYLVESFQAMPAQRSIRTDLKKLSIASLFCEAFDLILKEEQDSGPDSERYYETFTLGIQALEESEKVNDLLKSCFLTLKGLLCVAGFLEAERTPVPNMKNLRILLDHLEVCLEKRLITREEFERICLT